jgi:putative endonuclease
LDDLKFAGFAWKPFLSTFVTPKTDFWGFYQGDVAQLVEQRTENPCVGGSIPSVTTLAAIALAKAAFFITFNPCGSSISSNAVMWSFYKGCTSNLEERLERHQKGWVESTKDLLPVKLIAYTAFPNQSKAYAFEKYLKSGSGRAFLKKHIV